ncbi:hypothetical protein MTR67_049151 [Solanum verrucosum]|uniref:DUF4283 domain-containing protein n=1 Tax=Solanum verrucosum TaxID=315347 RepID=A0AAF0V2X1_SOLVR|nr:hypothetical protein MTR67_049151 [Solanum verrucosum]
MANIIFFKLGGKSYDLTDTNLASDSRFEWVESVGRYVRRMKLSRAAIQWLCGRFNEASEIKGKSFKTWRCRDLTTLIYCSLKYNKYGRFVSVIPVKGELRSIIILPEISFNAGWSDLSKKIEVFIIKTEISQRETLNAREITRNGQKGKRSYKEALQKGRWLPNEFQSTPESSTNGDKDPFRRSLVGSFPDCDEIPSRNDSRRDADNVFAGRWSRSNHLLELEWWSPTTGAIQAQQQFDLFWVRILGLPLHLWSDKVMKEIGDQCGGWIEVEEETQLKNHLRWAHIRVKGPLKTELISNACRAIRRRNTFCIWKEALIAKLFVDLYSKGGIVLEVLDQIGIKGSGSHEAQLPKKGPIQLEKEPFVDDLFSTENSFFPSSNITEMEMGTGVRTEISFAKDDVAIYFGLEVLGGEDNNLPMVIYDTEGARINSAETNKIDLHQGFCSSEQITSFADPLPLQINDSLSEQEIEDKVSLWVHSNVLKLSQLFGVAFKGCDKAAFDLFLRIDQKRGDLRQKKVETTPIKAKNTISKEIRNLEFHVKFKEGESRNKGRISNTNFDESQNPFLECKSGGIVVMWDKRVWRGELVIAANQMVTCKFEGINQALTWFLSAVYASCDPITRRELWQEFINIKELCNGPWVACGSEGHEITTPMTEFSEWINEMEFIDPHLFGGSFTWRRGDNHMSASRLDRFLFSSQWDGTFTGIKQSILPRIGSDHSPILLECGDLNLKKSYFKFEQWWSRVEGFSDKVKDWWESFNITGTGSYVLASKLRMLKGKLKEWKRENRNNWNQRKEEILNQLSILKKTQELRLL